MISAGVTNPAEITSLAASSTDMSRKIISFSGRNNKNPDVGFGVVGKNILYSSLSLPILFSTSPFVFVDTNATAQIPFLGYSTRHALSKELFD